MADEPHELGWKAHLPLAHAGPRCGAKNRAGGSCRAPAMAKERCRSPGGKSPGPMAGEGLERSRRAGLMQGHYSAEGRERRARSDRRMLEDPMEELQASAI